MFVDFKIFENELMRAGLYGVWGLCIMEMAGIIKTNIHTTIGNMFLIYFGLYSIYQEAYGVKNKEDKSKAINNMLLAFSNEIKNALEDSQPPDIDPQTEEEPFMYSAEYFKEQMELIEKSLKSVEEINENLKSVGEHVDCPHDYQCVKCDQFLDTTLPCNDGDHWFKCNRCDIIQSDAGTLEIDYTNDYILGTVQSPRKGREMFRSQIRTSCFESRSRSRSRSRDREGDLDCDHDMRRCVVGYDDIYDKCSKCGYEVCR